MDNNIYSCFHYHKKCKKDREAIEALLPEIEKISQKVVFGNIGDIKYTTRTNVPNGGFWCDGQTIAKSDLETVYEMLISGKLQCVDIATYNNVIALEGSCGFFGLDTASETFRVPLLDEIYIKAGQVADEFGAESLPNIKGSLDLNRDRNVFNGNQKGAFYRDSGNGTTWAATSSSSNASGDIYFDASRSSSTYKDGAKVNPNHVKYRAYVMLFNDEKELSIIDWTNQIENIADNRINELSNFADNRTTQLANLANDKTTQISDLADNRTSQLTNLANNQTNQLNELADNLKEELIGYGAITITYWE